MISLCHKSTDSENCEIISNIATKQIKVLFIIHLALKGTADILTINDQIVFKAYHKYGMHSNIKPKGYNCIIEHSTYQISDLSRKSYKTQDKSSSNAY